MDILSLLDKDRSKWHKIVVSLGCPDFYAEDIIQDMYLKIHNLKDNKRIMYEDSGELNYWYVILTLRSVCYDFLKFQGRYVDWEPIDINDEYTDFEREDAFNILYDKVISATNEFGRYGSKLTQVYFKTDYSIRKIASETTISTSSIFHSIKMYRMILQERFGEDYEDYINGDYNHIK